MKFKPGDRVYFESQYAVRVSGFGVIKNVDGILDWYFIEPDTHLGIDRVLVSIEEGDVIEFESIYNSPLWKALS